MLLMLAWRPMAYAAVWATVVYVLFQYAGMHFLRLPFLPIATVGTAVAFYVGFKNNASYDRFWEARKIWGGVVNESRTWATQVLAYVLPKSDDADSVELRRRLIYRQLAWINALRLQLRKNSRFLQKDAHPKTAERLQNHATHMRNDWDLEVGPFLGSEEHARLKNLVNPATHLLNEQAQELKELVNEKRLDLFHQIALMEVVRELFALQGKCERIKNTPFPRQYAEFSRWFTRALVVLMPCGLLSIFPDQLAAAQNGGWDLLRLLPLQFSAGLVTWVFVTMEGIGDASEDPFERSINDVPMNGLCRAIERDLRQLLKEDDIPDVEKPIGNILY